MKKVHSALTLWKTVKDIKPICISINCKPLEEANAPQREPDILNTKTTTGELLSKMDEANEEEE